MKKLIIVAAIALFTLNTYAAEKPVEPNNSLRTEIVNLLGDSLVSNFVENQFTVEVIFTVNNQGEVVILSTDATDKKIENKIKKKLNYKKVNFRTEKNR